MVIQTISKKEIEAAAVIIVSVSKAVTDQRADSMVNYLKESFPDKTIIFSRGELPKITLRRSWFHTLRSMAARLMPSFRG